jgi:hypothetical protein
MGIGRHRQMYMELMGNVAYSCLMAGATRLTPDTLAAAVDLMRPYVPPVVPDPIPRADLKRAMQAAKLRLQGLSGESSLAGEDY